MSTTRFRSHSITAIVVLVLLTFLEGGNCAIGCAFAGCPPALPSHACDPSHSKDIDLGGCGGNEMASCGNPSESGSTNCSCEYGYVAATDAYRNPLPSQHSLSDFLTPGQVITPLATLGHKDRTPAGASPLPNLVLSALRTVVLLN
jgi:hypothetical protein